MRQVVSTEFCSPCKEGLWLEILSRVDLIDHSTITCDENTSVTKMRIETVELKDYLTIRWFEGDKERKEFQDLKEIHVERAEIWKVQVELKTKEIRKDANGLTKSWNRWDTVHCIEL
jgi:hypothetical protein